MTETASQEIVLLEPIIEKYSIARVLSVNEQRGLYEDVNKIVGLHRKRSVDILKEEIEKELSDLE